MAMNTDGIYGSEFEKKKQQKKYEEKISKENCFNYKVCSDVLFLTARGNVTTIPLFVSLCMYSNKFSVKLFFLLYQRILLRALLYTLTIVLCINCLNKIPEDSKYKKVDCRTCNYCYTLHIGRLILMVVLWLSIMEQTRQ